MQLPFIKVASYPLPPIFDFDEGERKQLNHNPGLHTNFEIPYEITLEIKEKI